MMKSPYDLSVGQRLGMGFGLVFVIFAGLLILVFGWHASSAKAQAEYSERITPMRSRMQALEREVYQTAISVRAVLIAPTTNRIAEAQANADDVRVQLQLLNSMSLQAENKRALSHVATAAQEYLAQVSNILRERAQRPTTFEAEAALSERREALLGFADEFDVLAETQANAALARIAAVRDRTATGLLAATFISAAALLCLAWFTSRSVSRPTRALLGIARALELGDWQPALEYAPREPETRKPPVRDEMRRVARAFGATAAALERRDLRLRAENNVAKAIASTLDREQLCNQALRYIVDHLNAAVGIVYCTGTRPGYLRAVATHAVSLSPADVEMGDGVPGQAALGKRIVTLTDIPPDSLFTVKIGYDQAPPKMVVAAPLVCRESVEGVVLVGSLHKFCPEQVDFIEASATQLAIGLQNIGAHERTQKLLLEVSEMSSVVQKQNEELQVQNEEIQAQSQQLQAQHEEIQAQNEELIQQSADLRSHAASLAEADDRKNKFLGVLAHELRNPMAPIANSIFILKRTPPNSDAARRAQDIIERQAGHLARLIDDLLDVTRISEGKIHIQRRRLDLVEVVRACVEDAASAFEQSQISVELDLPDAAVEVDGDRTRLCQVIGNLLNNSAKFGNPSGMVKISLRIDHDEGSAVLRVIDDGIGMEHDLLPKLFVPFTQGLSSLDRANGGLGLGLALVKSLVHLHGGAVDCFSAGIGKGAEFTVRLPLAEARATRLREYATQKPEQLRGISAHASALRRILIIEDNKDAAHTLRDALAFERFEIDVAYSGVEGLEKAKAAPPDVVLCDLGLPGLDGYAVAQALRADERTRSALLIALTGYASAKDKEKAHAAGFDVHLSKPLNVSGLFSLLSDRDADSEPESPPPSGDSSSSTPTP